MFAFFLLGALAAAMIILPTSSHEDLDLDDWSFWVSDGIGRLAKYAADADECYTDEEAAAASRIENWWLRKIQTRVSVHSCNVAVLAVPRDFTPLTNSLSL